MPTYTYRDAAGRTVDLNVPMAKRDQQEGLERVEVPSRLGYQAGAIDPHSPEAMVPKAFKKMEETESARSIAKKVQFSIDHVRRVWNFCLAFLFVVSVAHAQDVAPGYLFLPADTVTSTKLNNAASGAINTSFYTSKAAETTPDNTDTLLIYSSILSGYRKVTFGNAVGNNTVLISGKSESTLPGTNAFVLFLDANTGSLLKLNLTNALTNVLATLPNQTNPIVKADRLVGFDSRNAGAQSSFYVSNAFPSFMTTNIPFPLVWQSGANISFSANHSFPRNPDYIHWTLYCTNADLSYSSNDEVELSSVIAKSTSIGYKTNQPLFSVWVNATTINLGSFAGGGVTTPQIQSHPSGGAISYQDITTNKWLVRCRAICFPLQ